MTEMSFYFRKLPSNAPLQGRPLISICPFHLKSSVSPQCWERTSTWGRASKATNYLTCLSLFTCLFVSTGVWPFLSECSSVCSTVVLAVVFLKMLKELKEVSGALRRKTLPLLAEKPREQQKEKEGVNPLCVSGCGPAGPEEPTLQPWWRELCSPTPPVPTVSPCLSSHTPLLVSFPHTPRSLPAGALPMWSMCCARAETCWGSRKKEYLQISRIGLSSAHSQFLVNHCCNSFSTQWLCCTHMQAS